MRYIPRAALLELVGRLGLGVWEGSRAEGSGTGVAPGTAEAAARHRAPITQADTQTPRAGSEAVQLQGTGSPKRLHCPKPAQNGVHVQAWESCLCLAAAECVFTL